MVTTRHPFVSIFIILIIALHAIPIIQELRGHRQTLWPFMAWGMYRYSHDADRPIVTSVRRTIGITSNGEELNIEPMHWPRFFNLFRTKNAKNIQLVGLNRFALQRLYLDPLWKRDCSAARRLTHWLNPKLDNPIVIFRLESETYTITDSALDKKANPTIICQVVD